MLKSSIKERLSYLDASLPLSEDLAEIKTDVKLIKETEMILASEINATKHAVEKIGLNSCFCAVNAIKVDTAPSCNKSAESNENQQSHECGQNQPTSCLEVLKAGCNKSAVYQLSLGTDKTKVTVILCNNSNEYENVNCCNDI